MIGWLGPESREAEDIRVVPFRQGLKDGGYVEGQNLAISIALRMANTIDCRPWSPTWFAGKWL